MNELKPCPFCGGKAITATFLDYDDLEYMAFEVNDSESIDGEVTCENERCINGWYLSPKDWNIRPIEDALNKRIAELEAYIDQLIGAGWLIGSGIRVWGYVQPMITQYDAERWNALVADWKEREE